ncbi:MAG: hypothetical protein U0414_43725 [Polyangiaceae bacterium]
MIDRTLVSTLVVLALAVPVAASGCKQSVVAGSNLGGGGSGSSTSGASQSSTGGGGDPAAWAAEVCAKRAACETVEPTCEKEYTCYFALFREDLWTTVEPCFSACGSFDSCFYGVAAMEAPPPAYEVYKPKCDARLVGQCQLGDDWCDYNCFTGAEYEAMIPCLELPCADIVDCYRTVVFADHPTCTSI